MDKVKDGDIISLRVLSDGKVFTVGERSPLDSMASVELIKQIADGGYSAGMSNGDVVYFQDIPLYATYKGVYKNCQKK